MRIGIISVNNAHNFGTCMQAYAFKAYLETLGHEVQVINYRIPKIETSYKIYKKKPKKNLYSKTIWLMSYAMAMAKKPYLIKRRKSHEEFFLKYYNLTNETTSIKELRNCNYDFDVVFAGSDQIWNKEIIGNINPAFFCDFLNAKTIKASYAASIGRDSLDVAEREVFKHYLKRLDYISVREEKARDCIKELTDQKISIVLDPTLLVSRQIYDKLLKKPKFKGEYIYVHVHHYSAKGLELIEAAEELSEKTGLPVVHNLQNASFKNELGKTRSMGPEDVLTTVANAKMIVTQSFHITVFSLIYEKWFITLARDKFSDRMENLLRIVGLEEHYVRYQGIGTLPGLENNVIDYRRVKEKLFAYREHSIKYIDMVLSERRKNYLPDYFESGDKYNCYGCSLCHDICPVHAISMQEDEEGFVFPQIDKESCTFCGLCRKECIYNHLKRESFESLAYFCYHKDEDERMNSTSGGMFAAFSEYVISQNGYVIGVKYNENFEVIYDIAHTTEECMAFRFSKYVEPKHNNIYKKTEEVLKSGKPVLFTGSPCKIAGLKNYLKKDYDNLYLVDIICECTSSPVAFKKYLEAKEKSKKSKIVSIQFRSKMKGWDKRATEIKFEDSSSECTTERWNIYYHCFISAYLAKRSCYNCQFCGDNKIADVTIGDFWKAEKVINKKLDDKGYSAVKVGSEKGIKLLEAVSDKLYIQKVTCKEIYDNNHAWPVDLTEIREKILKEITDKNNDAIYILKKYNSRYNKK